MDETETRVLCSALLTKAWPVYLTTIDEEGFPQTRAMFNLRNEVKFPELVSLFNEIDTEFTIIFSTNTSSSKVTDIRRNPLASVYYCIPDDWQGVMFGGSIEIVEDENIKRKLWQDGWERYYPQGYNDPDHTVLRLEPNVAKGWNGSRTFKLKLR